MRLTTKFSAFFTLLTGLTILATLIGSSLSFYNGIQYKVKGRVEAVATVLDNRLLNHSFEQLAPQLDEMFAPVDVVSVDFLQDGKRYTTTRAKAATDRWAAIIVIANCSLTLLSIPACKLSWNIRIRWRTTSVR
ncbi:hypothetical protein ACFOJF_23335 [Pseudocitrobacter faecalis]